MDRNVKLALPKGRMQEGVFALLADAGVRVRMNDREYRPTISLPGFDAKILKPQNVIEMLHAGSRDVGFAGRDWVTELDGELVELLDTGLDPVRLVAAMPEALAASDWKRRRLVVASEYEGIAKKWIKDNDLNAEFVRSYGATEVFPPEDADVIVDNTATGSTLRANGLVVVAELMDSTTRLYANPKALEEPGKREAAERLVLLLSSVLNARKRVMVEVNVDASRLEAVVAALPCMREPTVASLHGNAGFAVKAAVPRSELARLIPEIRARGGTDIIVTALSQIVP